MKCSKWVLYQQSQGIAVINLSVISQEDVLISTITLPAGAYISQTSSGICGVSPLTSCSQESIVTLRDAHPSEIRCRELSAVLRRSEVLLNLDELIRYLWDLACIIQCYDDSALLMRSTGNLEEIAGLHCQRSILHCGIISVPIHLEMLHARNAALQVYFPRGARRIRCLPQKSPGDCLRL